MSAPPFADVTTGPIGPRDDETTSSELVVAVLRISEEEEQAAREAFCTTCDGGRYVTDGDDRLARCPECSERES